MDGSKRSEKEGVEGGHKRSAQECECEQRASVATPVHEMRDCYLRTGCASAGERCRCSGPADSRKLKLLEGELVSDQQVPRQVRGGLPLDSRLDATAAAAVESVDHAVDPMVAEGTERLDSLHPRRDTGLMELAVAAGTQDGLGVNGHGV